MTRPIRWHASIIAQAMRFGMVGALGFLVDAGVLYALVACHVSPLWARCLSFPAGLTATWLLNSRWTFLAQRSGAGRARQAAAYASVQCVGAAVNYGVYALALRLTGRGPIDAVLALAAGSAIGMVVNFIGARRLVFRTPR